MHTQAQRCTREEWSWASEPEGLTVRGGFYMHRCNLMVQNYISLCGPCWEEKNLSSTSYSPSQLASTILANQAVEWQVNLVTQVEHDWHYTMNKSMFEQREHSILKEPFQSNEQVCCSCMHACTCMAEKSHKFPYT